MPRKIISICLILALVAVVSSVSVSKVFAADSGTVLAELPIDDPGLDPNLDSTQGPGQTQTQTPGQTQTQGPGQTQTQTPGQTQTQSSGGGGTCTFDQNGTELCNPIPQKTLLDIVISLVKAFLAIIAVFAVAMIVIGGGRLVISAGNEEEVKKAKSTITWAIIGMVIALLSYTIVSIITNLIRGKV